MRLSHDLTPVNKASGKKRFVYSHRAQPLSHGKLEASRRNINESSHLRLHSRCETERQEIIDSQAQAEPGAG